MPATNAITLEMLHNELKRIRSYMNKHYPDFVKKHKITPYDRDHRQACNAKMIDLVEQAIKNKGTSNPKLLQLLTQLP